MPDFEKDFEGFLNTKRLAYKNNADFTTSAYKNIISKIKGNPKLEERLAYVVRKLCRGESITEASYNDHQLTDKHRLRELHISGDILLVYRIDENKHVISFTTCCNHKGL
jgi:mRNA interferase YafQ